MVPHAALAVHETRVHNDASTDGARLVGCEDQLSAYDSDGPPYLHSLSTSTFQRKSAPAAIVDSVLQQRVRHEPAETPFEQVAPCRMADLASGAVLRRQWRHNKRRRNGSQCCSSPPFFLRLLGASTSTMQQPAVRRTLMISHPVHR
jgi:hypothetical protein